MNNLDPKYAPYKCACHTPFWDKTQFRLHFTECLEAQEFIKITKRIIAEYERLGKIYANPEEFT